MANEDWFLRLDPYNFDTEEEYYEFYYAEEKEKNYELFTKFRTESHNYYA